MADRNDVLRKRHSVEMELLEHISENIKKGANASYLSELTLAFRYLEGGAQPGSAIVKQ